MFKINPKNPQPASLELQNSKKFRGEINESVHRSPQDHPEQSNQASRPPSLNEHRFELIEGAMIGESKKLDSCFSKTMWVSDKDPQCYQVCRQAHRIDQVKKKVLSSSKSNSHKSSGEIRPIKVLPPSISLKNLQDLTQFLEEESKDFHFEPNAAREIAEDIVGKIKQEKFLELLHGGKISIERVGWRKAGAEDKYYLIIRDPKEEGGLSVLVSGYSRRGSPRAVTIRKGNNENTACLRKRSQRLNKRDLIRNQNLELAKLLTKENAPNVCQMMSYEDGIKVSRLGDMDINQLNLEKLTKMQRLNLYRSLFKGIFQMHSLGLCHRDLKCENVVVHINEEEEPIAWIIDFLDFLEEEGKNRLGTPIIGTYCMWSPDCVAAYEKWKEQSKQPVQERTAVALANPKDDVWAAMLIICELESPLTEQHRMLSPELIEVFEEYKRTVMDIDEDIEDLLEHFHNYFKTHPNNLFDAKRASITEYPLDCLIYQMGSMRSERRLSSKEVLEWLPEHPDSFRIDVPVSRQTVMELQALRKNFLTLSNLGDLGWKECEQRYNACIESCEKGFKDTFSVVCRKIVQIKAPEAWQKHEGQHSISSSQHCRTPEIRDDIELQALEHLLNNLYVHFLDEKKPVHA